MPAPGAVEPGQYDYPDESEPPAGLAGPAAPPARPGRFARGPHPQREAAFPDAPQEDPLADPGSPEATALRPAYPGQDGAEQQVDGYDYGGYPGYDEVAYDDGYSGQKYPGQEYAGEGYPPRGGWPRGYDEPVDAGTDYDAAGYADHGYADPDYVDGEYADEAYDADGYPADLYEDEDGFYDDEYPDGTYADDPYEAGLYEDDLDDAEAQQETEDETDAESSPLREWLLMAGQLAVGVVGGAGVWLAFNWLWGAIPTAALVAALVVIVGLVWVVRKIRRAEDLQTTVLAVLVGLVVTVSPASLLLLGH